jgi:hypothetical protein
LLPARATFFSRSVAFVARICIKSSFVVFFKSAPREAFSKRVELVVFFCSRVYSRTCGGIFARIRTHSTCVADSTRLAAFDDPAFLSDLFSSVVSNVPSTSYAFASVASWYTFWKYLRTLSCGDVTSIPDRASMLEQSRARWICLRVFW